MPKRNNELVVVNDWKDDLRMEADVQCRAAAVSCMEGIKKYSTNFAVYAIRRVFDHWIDNIKA